MLASRRPWTVWLLRYPAKPGPRPPIEPPDTRRPADFTAVPRTHPSRSLLPIKPIQIAGRLGSLDRAGRSRRALELVRTGNHAVEAGHRAAVIRLGDAHEQLGDAVGSGRQRDLVVQLQPGRIGIFAPRGASRQVRT